MSQILENKYGGHSNMKELLTLINQATKSDLNGATLGSELLPLLAYLYSFQTLFDDAS